MKLSKFKIIGLGVALTAIPALAGCGSASNAQNAGVGGVGSNLSGSGVCPAGSVAISPTSNGTFLSFTTTGASFQNNILVAGSVMTDRSDCANQPFGSMCTPRTSVSKGVYGSIGGVAAASGISNRSMSTPNMPPYTADGVFNFTPDAIAPTLNGTGQVGISPARLADFFYFLNGRPSQSIGNYFFPFQNPSSNPAPQQAQIDTFCVNKIGFAFNVMPYPSSINGNPVPANSLYAGNVWVWGTYSGGNTGGFVMRW